MKLSWRRSVYFRLVELCLNLPVPALTECHTNLNSTVSYCILITPKHHMTLICSQSITSFTLLGSLSFLELAAGSINGVG